jgi:hypothetical protein
MRKAAVLLPLIGGCIYSEYSPGDLGAGARSYGCVDVVAVPQDSYETPPGGHMIDIELGNRCDHSVPTNFGAIKVSLRREGKTGETPANAYDPRGEIHPARIPANLHVHERIIFFPANRDCGEIDRVCVDVDGLVPETTGDTRFCWGGHVEGTWQ